MENETKFRITQRNKAWYASRGLAYETVRSSKTKLCHFLNKHTVMTLKEGEAGELTFRIIKGEKQ